MNTIYSSKWRFTHVGVNVTSDEQHYLMDKYSLNDIEDFFDTIDEPAAHTAYMENNSALVAIINDHFGRDIVVNTKLLGMKSKASYEDDCRWDDDEDYSGDESIQVTYRFSYMIVITSALDINVLKLKYPNMFNNENSGLRTLLKQRSILK